MYYMLTKKLQNVIMQVCVEHHFYCRALMIRPFAGGVK